jgi:hypothetical protein
VDRFDVGRVVGSSLQPTAVVPGDVVIHCTVGPEEARALSGSLAQAELLKTLQLSLVTPEPSSLLHLHVHIRTQQSNSRNPSLAITCTV